MSNNCTHCLHKGDIKACKATECHAHESWYALEMIAQNAKLVEALEDTLRLQLELETASGIDYTILEDDQNKVSREARKLLQQLKENN